MIEASQIATNRYAPTGSQAINLYSTGAAEDLTLGQLVAAVCIRTAGALEEQSVNKMNLMSVGTEKLEKASVYMQEIAEERMSDWAAAKSYLADTVGVTGLPDDLSTYEKRMQAVNAIKEKLEAMTQQAQEDMIDLQTLINRRDMTFNTSSNIIKAMGNSKNNAAGKMI
ncbi:MAG: hypothetical protein J6R18_01450 [Kiritimatiellae bacterium]|nr:hypothetical protein [Kiritimatiellia bacterium]